MEILAPNFHAGIQTYTFIYIHTNHGSSCVNNIVINSRLWPLSGTKSIIKRQGRIHIAQNHV